MTQFGVSIAADGVVGDADACAPECQFGFRVHKAEPEEWDWRKAEYQRIPGTETWAVSLPHQCDRWEITYAPHDEAVAELEAFIAEAQAALWLLKNKQTTVA